jgi:transposase
VKARNLVFLDEFGAATNMARTHGRGPRGQRVVDKIPHGHWKTLTTVAAMSVKGIFTAVSYDGAMNGECFIGFIEQFLVPMLRPGQVVILDNLPAHKSAEVDRLIDAARARVVRLPPYSPDFNPIEMAISKTKSLLRKEAARTIDTLIDAVGRGLGSITKQDSAHYIEHCGYGARLR